MQKTLTKNKENDEEFWKRKKDKRVVTDFYWSLLWVWTSLKNSLKEGRKYGENKTYMERRTRYHKWKNEGEMIREWERCHFLGKRKGNNIQNGSF